MEKGNPARSLPVTKHSQNSCWDQEVKSGSLWVTVWISEVCRQVLAQLQGLLTGLGIIHGPFSKLLSRSRKLVILKPALSTGRKTLMVSVHACTNALPYEFNHTIVTVTEKGVKSLSRTELTYKFSLEKNWGFYSLKTSKQQIIGWEETASISARGRKFTLAIGKNLLTERVEKHWSRVLGEVVKSPSI